MLQAGRSRVLIPMRSLIFSLYLILTAATSPGVYYASNRIEYHKIFLGSKARPLRNADNSRSSLSRFSRQCGSSLSHNPIGL
jgi:hypothetical protein